MIAPRLSPGGLIGLCSPSHIARREVYEPVGNTLRSRGYRVLEADNLYRDTDGYLATPQERAADFNQLIRHPEVELVFFGGGEGSCELLPYIDFDALRAHPKRICTYSDGTTILDAIYLRTGLEVYYGMAPRQLVDAEPYAWENFTCFLTQDALAHIASGPWQTLVPGKAEGTLLGGYARNVALLLGDPQQFHIDPDARFVLFLEDHEKFGGVDYVSAMLSNIEQRPFIRQVTGLLFGHYSEPTNQQLLARLRRFGQEHGIPVAYCDDFGHGAHHAILRVGHPVCLDTEACTLRYL